MSATVGTSARGEAFVVAAGVVVQVAPTQPTGGVVVELPFARPVVIATEAVAAPGVNVSGPPEAAVLLQLAGVVVNVAFNW